MRDGCRHSKVTISSFLVWRFSDESASDAPFSSHTPSLQVLVVRTDISKPLLPEHLETTWPNRDPRLVTDLISNGIAVLSEISAESHVLERREHIGTFPI